MIPSIRAVAFAILLGGAAGTIGAFWLTLEDSKGLVLSDTDPGARAPTRADPGRRAR